ncbi:MAG: PRC-barrel domain-containing protein [Hyphomicrobiaceae bacterium]
MNKAVLVAAALVLSPMAVWSQELPQLEKSAVPSERTDDLLQSAVEDRVAQSIDRVADACAADMDDFCGRVTSGGGRFSLCMLAHEDQLSSGCRSALYRISRDLRRDVERTAEACWNEIKTVCGETEKVGQCLGQKKSSLSSSCQTIIGAMGQKLRGLAVGMAVYSSDNKNLGQVVEVIKGPDNKVQSIQVDIGRVLGLGTKVITITADKLERLPGIKIQLSEAEVRSLPEAKK